MNRKNLLGLIMVILMITSGPVYLPLAYASTNQTEGVDLTNQPASTITNGTLPKPTRHPRIPFVTVYTSVKEGVSPLPVKIWCTVDNLDRAKDIMFYGWDFDGDGLHDKVTQSENTVMHIYETRVEKTFNVTVTVGFKDGSHHSAKAKVSVKPVDYTAWHEIREIGAGTKLGVMMNGSLVLYDESSWLPVTFTEYNEKLSENRFTGIDSTSRRLS
jgi:hypothetical protein